MDNPYNQALCDERHKRIDEFLKETKETLNDHTTLLMGIHGDMKVLRAGAQSCGNDMQIRVPASWLKRLLPLIIALLCGAAGGAVTKLATPASSARDSNTVQSDD